MTKNYKYKYQCAQCGKDSVAYIANTKICSDECRNKYWSRDKHRTISKDISTGTVGAISELKVSSKFLMEGYAVFRSLSQACFCDLIAIKNDEVLYLEVRTGYISVNGKLEFIKKISNIVGTPTHYAVYVFKDDSIHLVKI